MHRVGSQLKRGPTCAAPRADFLESIGRIKDNRGPCVELMAEAPAREANEPMPESEKFSTNRIAARIFAVILAVDAVILYAFARLGADEHPFLAGAAAVALLALVATPAIYLVAVRPFAQARDRALEEASRLALIDPLTQVANRRHFQQVLAREHARRSRSASDLSLIVFDIDHFKDFNDRYGHVRGDDCLKRVAQTILARMTRAADVAARFGGDEFVCILPETSLQGARAIAEEIRGAVEAMRIPHLDSSASEHVTVSAGIACASGHHAPACEDLLNEADKLLYLAKAKGRNRVESDAGVLDGKRAASFVRLVWREAYVSGNDTIDEQHRQLFRVADELLSGVLAGRKPDEVLLLVSALLGDLRQHFRDELRIVTALGYPEARAHGEDHQRLLAEAERLAEDCERGVLSVGELFQFLAQEVIIKHLLTEDRKFFVLTRSDREAVAA